MKPSQNRDQATGTRLPPDWEALPVDLNEESAIARAPVGAKQNYCDTAGVSGNLGRALEVMRVVAEEPDTKCPDLENTVGTCVLPEGASDLPNHLLHPLPLLPPDDVKLMSFTHCGQGRWAADSPLTGSCTVQAKRLAAATARAGDDPVCHLLYMDTCAACSSYRDCLVVPATVAGARVEG